MTACEELGLIPTATVAEVKTVWRDLATTYHPDKPGGNSEVFDRYRKIYLRALAEAEAPLPCEPCQGTGSTRVVNGWVSINVICGACGGTGTISREGI
jgi:DnaJ-class molecular chaperone